MKKAAAMRKQALPERAAPLLSAARGKSTQRGRPRAANGIKKLHYCSPVSSPSPQTENVPLTTLRVCHMNERKMLFLRAPAIKPKVQVIL